MNKEPIGALWQKVSKKEETYLTGTINGEQVIIFSNRKKNSSNQPDYRVYKSEPREGSTA